MAEEPGALFSAPLCLSGGAEGADQQFGMCAGMAGHTVLHWSYNKARVHVPLEEVVRLTPEQLAEADPFLKEANKTLGRNLNPGKPWMMNLLRRNWYQVKDSGSVYAVSTITDGLVDGGTAWAVQMFIDQHDGATCPCYVFDQKVEHWFTWVAELVEVETPDDPLFAHQSVLQGRWQPIDAPPPPKGVYAGIGSRKLLAAGKAAIRRLLGYVPPQVPAGT